MIVKEAKKQNTKPVDFDRSKSPVITLTLIMGCILLCWLFAVTYLPDSTLFQRPASNFTADTAGYIVPEAGVVFEEQFTMPYDRLFSININWDKADLTASTPIDADLHLLCGDQVVCSKKIVTPNDIFTIPKNTQISKGTEYTFRLVINRNDGEAKLMVPAEAKGTSAPAMSINGNNYGAGASFFTNSPQMIFPASSSGLLSFATASGMLFSLKNL